MSHSASLSLFLLSLFYFHYSNFTVSLSKWFSSPSFFLLKRARHTIHRTQILSFHNFYFFTNQSGLDSFSSPQKSLSLPFMHRAKRFLPFSFFSSKIHLLSFSISNYLANRRPVEWDGEARSDSPIHRSAITTHWPFTCLVLSVISDILKILPLFLFSLQFFCPAFFYPNPFRSFLFPTLYVLYHFC